MSHSKDDLVYSKPLKKVADFAFDEAVASVFPDMIERSVPGYSAIIPLLGMLAEHYIQPQTCCYDLGCSLGAASFSVGRFLQNTDKNVQGCKIIAVDNSPVMIEKCRAHLQHLESVVPYELLCDDINNVKFQAASVVILNFTLQFIDVPTRHKLLQKVYDALVPGGCLLLSEKLISNAEQQSDMLAELHYVFKKANGYSELEISQKRTALENVLVPESLQQHQKRLHEIGFVTVKQWFQCFNFSSMLAIK